MNELYTSEMWSMSANVDTSGQTDDIILEVIKKSISEQQFLKQITFYDYTNILK